MDIFEELSRAFGGAQRGGMGGMGGPQRMVWELGFLLLPIL
jgi:hypothetical protein